MPLLGSGHARSLRKGCSVWAVILALVFTGPVRAADEEHPLAVAYRDLLTIPKPQRIYIRYFSLKELPLDLRVKAFQANSIHVNQLSTGPDIVQPVIVRDVSGHPTVLRVNLEPYSWDFKTWEKLADADKYYREKIKAAEVVSVEFERVVKKQWDATNNRWVMWNGAAWYEFDDNKQDWMVLAQAPRTTAKKGGEVVGVATWFVPTQANQLEIKKLIEECQTQVPIVRADFFFWQTAVQFKRNPGYYDFLGIKDQKTFQEVIGFDAKILKKFPQELLEAVKDSGVTVEPRLVGRNGKIGGSEWFTLDNEEALGEANPLRNFGKNFQFKATRRIGHLPNGFLAWFLGNNLGERQDSAPDFVGRDGTAAASASARTRNNGKIEINLGCVRCHGPHSGFQPINAFARTRYHGGKLSIQTPDPEESKRLTRLYLTDLKGPMEDDQRIYARAVKRATISRELPDGLTPTEAARVYGDFWDYCDQPVDAEMAARESYTTRPLFVAALEHQLRPVELGGKGFLDPLLAEFLEGGTVPRLQWAEVFIEAQRHVLEYRQLRGEKRHDEKIDRRIVIVSVVLARLGGLSPGFCSPGGSGGEESSRGCSAGLRSDVRSGNGRSAGLFRRLYARLHAAGPKHGVADTAASSGGSAAQGTKAAGATASTASTARAGATDSATHAAERERPATDTAERPTQRTGAGQRAGCAESGAVTRCSLSIAQLPAVPRESSGPSKRERLYALCRRSVGRTGRHGSRNTV